MEPWVHGLKTNPNFAVKLTERSNHSCHCLFHESLCKHYEKNSEEVKQPFFS